MSLTVEISGVAPVQLEVHSCTTNANLIQEIAKKYMIEDSKTFGLVMQLEKKGRKSYLR